MTSVFFSIENIINCENRTRLLRHYASEIRETNHKLHN